MQKIKALINSRQFVQKWIARLLENHEAEVKDLCRCRVDHLQTIHGLVLHYKNASHIPASDFLAIKGIVLTEEDHAVAPPDDEVDEDSEMIEERLLLPVSEITQNQFIPFISLLIIVKYFRLKERHLMILASNSNGL